MPKVRTDADITAASIEPRDAEEKRTIDRLISKDQKLLVSFVKNLNNGATLDDMDHELRSWWMNRY